MCRKGSASSRSLKVLFELSLVWQEALAHSPSVTALFRFVGKLAADEKWPRDSDV
jgi:hypothetical protein